MINVNISNCNNITNGQIQIENDKLNIKYGITTIKELKAN